MPPTWLTTIALVWLALAALSVVIIVVDVARGYRQHMRVMEWVWPITSLYFGPIALAIYWRYGRTTTHRYRAEHPDVPEPPYVVRVGISTSHCGAGCTVGDIVAEWLVFALGLSLLGAPIFASYVLDYTFAFVFGIAFQYFAIAAMQKVRFGELARRTLQADALSLTAFEIGLFAWMGLTWFVFFTNPHLYPDEPAFWFMMQIGMVLGFFTSYPANAWLIRRGVKEAM